MTTENPFDYEYKSKQTIMEKIYDEADNLFDYGPKKDDPDKK